MDHCHGNVNHTRVWPAMALRVTIFDESRGALEETRSSTRAIGVLSRAAAAHVVASAAHSAEYTLIKVGAVLRVCRRPRSRLCAPRWVASVTGPRPAN